MRYRISQNALAILHDALMAGASFVLALFLRLGSRTFEHTQGFLLESTVAFTATLLVMLLYYRAYRHVWRFTALSDLVTIAKAGTLALLVFYVGMFSITRLEGLPRSVPFIHWMTLMLCLMSGRVIWRLIHDGALIDRLMGRGTNRTPVLLIG
ncbi:MAG: hypothetical protein K2X09_04850, partial [Rickettsiales bacterium]|nr:hypothetical protein [Rickettsiales bacterium]